MSEIIVTYEGAGWYRFSPSGHDYYDCDDEITVRGAKALLETLHKMNLKCKHITNSFLLSHETVKYIQEFEPEADIDTVDEAVNSLEENDFVVDRVM